MILIWRALAVAGVLSLLLANSRSEDTESYNTTQNTGASYVSENSKAYELEDDVYQCSNGERIEYIKVCDGISDCPDGTDEFACEDQCVNNECDKNHNNSGNFKVNGSADDDYYRCNNGERIASIKVCDRHSDCTDGSDESKCEPCVNNECDKNHNFGNYKADGSADNEHYRCNNGQLIAYISICDGIVDCTDGSDESKCEPCNSSNNECGCGCRN